MRFKVSRTPPTRSTCTATTSIRTSRGRNVTFDFPAKIEGLSTWSSRRGTQIAELEVDRREARGRAAAACARRRRAALAAPRRGGPRPRRRAGPADPALAVRVGGGGRPGRVVRRARRRCGPSRGSRTPRERRFPRARVRSTPCCGAHRRRGCSWSSCTPGSPACSRRPPTSLPTSSTCSSGSGSRSLSVCSATSSRRSTRGGPSRAARLGGRAWPARARRRCAYPRGSGAGRRPSGSSAFAWLELVYPNRTTRARSRLALAYAAMQLVGMSVSASTRGRTAPTRSRCTSACSPAVAAARRDRCSPAAAAGGRAALDRRPARSRCCA